MRYTPLLVIFIVSLFACKKDKENPFEIYKRVPPVVINPVDTIDPASFVGIHNNILRPTCANSGCHDGTFEPDYRTLESSYSTLVLQPIIKNDPNNTYTYRVKPGDAEMSVLYQRLIKDIDGQSGLMPISVDPDSDWNLKKDQYISNVKTWINNGAKDQFGNNPTVGNLTPTFQGVVGYADAQTTVLPRGGAGLGIIKVPVGATKLRVYFSLTDDDTPAANLTYNKIKISNDQLQFANKPELDLVIGNSITAPGYFGSNVQYTHSIELLMSNYPANETQFMRVYVKDSNPEFTEVPNSGSADYIKTYFSFIRQ